MAWRECQLDRYDACEGGYKYLLTIVCVAAAMQGGKPGTKEAKLAHAAAKASNRGVPTRFATNMLMLLLAGDAASQSH